MLDTKYNHLQVEEGKYKNWLDKGYFKSGDTNKTPYTIILPPPNVTGKLHIGHAWDGTLQDIIIRHKRMQGYDTLYLPGMDHAAIATEVKVVNRLKEQGINKYEIGREAFLKHAWDWKEEYALSIREQWAKMGLSLDYSMEKFTLDKSIEDAVYKVFIDLYNKGYIYKGERIINWDPVSKTALSNEEVIYKDIEGAFYHLKYMLEDNSGYLEVATTRPETLFGDTAVAVNPNDKRYKHLIGTNVILPILNKKIPIVADDYAEADFGTGVVKITPAHDHNDFEVGNRHNLERIIVMNTDATMNELALGYTGLDRFDCRKKLIEDLDSLGLLIKVEKKIQNVGHSERTDVMIEPYLSKQWFVKMDVLAKQVIDNQNSDSKVNFVPERFEKTFSHWMEDCHDWCISRQLWWGHRIPAWYKDDEILVQVDSPGDDWIQDNDVLDTWFSSALWPFATLDWPNSDELIKRYYPNSCLVTGYDIIFFWVCRMIFQGIELLGEKPFNDCLIHGLVRASDGRKMSKSLGNGVDPMDVIEEFGCDSLRFFLATSTAPGMDLRYDTEKVSSTWNFINKLWNASRFVLMNIEDIKELTFTDLSISDKWILSKMNKLINKIDNHMEKYEFNVVGSEIYSFVWNDFCDWYIELTKGVVTDTTKSVLLTVLTNILKVLHPFMPYVTEEIYQMLPIKDSDSIMISSYPVYDSSYVFEDEATLELIIEFIKRVRKEKLDNNIGKDFYMNFNNELLFKNINLISKMLKLNNDFINKDISDLTTISIPFKDDIVTISYDGSLNKEAELENLAKEKVRLESSILRREKLLSNQGYVSKAPANIVEKEKNDLEKEKLELDLILTKLQAQ